MNRFVTRLVAAAAVGLAVLSLVIAVNARRDVSSLKSDVVELRTAQQARLRAITIQASNAGLAARKANDVSGLLEECLPELTDNVDALERYLRDPASGLGTRNYSRVCQAPLFGYGD